MRTAIDDYLRKDQVAGPVVAHAALLLRLNGLLKQLVPGPLGAAVRVANLKDGKIIVLADNGAVAVKLRQMTGRLQARFSAARVECKGIEVKVQPAESITESTASTPKPLSGQACGTLQRLRDSLPANSPLHGALGRFLSRVARVDDSQDSQQQEHS